jgi:hypothetical protein
MIEVEAVFNKFERLEDEHFSILERRNKMRDRKIVIGVASTMLAVMLLFSLLGVALAADPTADASRTIDPLVAEPGEDVEVTVTFENLLAEPKAFGLAEVIPDGWEFTRGTDDASVFKDTNYPTIEWVWFVVDAGATKIVTYTLTVPIDAEEGDYAINGTVLADEVENPVGGNTTITVEEEPPPVPVEYDLTISSSAGGEVSEPGEGTFSYGEGTPVGLVATASEGYEFVVWTGDVGTMTNRYAAATTITMNDDYSITANFQEVGGDGDGGFPCGMATLADFLPVTMVSMGLVVVWATKRRSKVS